MLYWARAASPPNSPGCAAPPAEPELLLLLKNTPGPACSSIVAEPDRGDAGSWFGLILSPASVRSPPERRNTVQQQFSALDRRTPVWPSCQRCVRREASGVYRTLLPVRAFKLRRLKLRNEKKKLFFFLQKLTSSLKVLMKSLFYSDYRNILMVLHHQSIKMEEIFALQ